MRMIVIGLVLCAFGLYLVPISIAETEISEFQFFGSAFTFAIGAVCAIFGIVEYWEQIH